MGNTNRVNIKIEQTKLEECNNCNKSFFKRRILFRIIPGILVGEPKNRVDPFEVFICSNCGNLHPSSKLVLTEEEILKLTPPSK